MVKSPYVQPRSPWKRISLCSPSVIHLQVVLTLARMVHRIFAKDFLQDFNLEP